MKIKYIFLIIKSLKQLGLKNVLLALIHKFFIYSGFYKKLSKGSKCPVPEKISIIPNTRIAKIANTSLIKESDDLLLGKFIFYKDKKFDLGIPPNWFFDPYSTINLESTKLLHWTKISAYKSLDIKNIWELSRWTWAPNLARAWETTNNLDYLKTFDILVDDWCKENIVNNGPNWLCGQEVAIRLINALQAWLIIDSKEDNNNIYPIKKVNRISFIKKHLERIVLTKSYAKSQLNNHWSSEAAALFIGGSWIGDSKYIKLGRIQIENSISNLVMEDGTFAQYSMNYHRFFLDTINQVESWRIRFSGKEFSKNFYKKINLSINWYKYFIDLKSGDGPNLGGNDGTFCFQLHDEEYRNFKPTLQLSNFLFNSKLNKPQGNWDSQLKYYVGLKIRKNKIDKNQKKIIKVFNHGGFVNIYPNEKTWGVLRIPKFKFRVSNLDPLHFDLWYQGLNILRDSGSFSYLNNENINYFQGIESHNCAQFDDKEPVSKISNFLFANEFKNPKTENIVKEGNSLDIQGSYECKFGKHIRKVEFNNEFFYWKITDVFTKFQKKITLRWNLINSQWVLKNNEVKNNLVNIQIISNPNNVKINLLDSNESLKYNQISRSKVLKIDSNKNPTKIITIVRLN